MAPKAHCTLNIKFLFIIRILVLQQVERYRIRDLQNLMQFNSRPAEPPQTTAAPTVATEEDDGGLPIWLIAVIVVACVVFIAVAVVVVFFAVM